MTAHAKGFSEARYPSLLAGYLLYKKSQAPQELDIPAEIGGEKK